MKFKRKQFHIKKSKKDPKDQKGPKDKKEKKEKNENENELENISNLEEQLKKLIESEEKIRMDLTEKETKGELIDEETQKLNQIEVEKKKLTQKIQKKKRLENEIERKLEMKSFQKKDHKKHQHKKHRRPHISSTSVRKNNSITSRSFGNFFYSQNDLFKPSKRHEEKKSQRDQKDKKGKPNEERKYKNRNKKNQKKKGKEEKNEEVKEHEMMMNMNHMENKKVEMMEIMKNKTPEEIYQNLSPQRRSSLFRSYIEFMVRNHVKDMHYFSLENGEKSRNEDYVLVSYLLENPKYQKMWEKKLFTRIHEVIQSNPESYWILEIFTGKKYKASANSNQQQRETYQTKFLQTLQNPNSSKSFFQSILH